MLIRSAVPSEYDEVGEMMVAAYSEIPGFPLPDDYAASLGDVRSRARDSDVLVAVTEDGIVGSVTYVPGVGSSGAEFDDPDGAGIRMLAVLPSARGRGIARALTEACIARARMAGRHIVVLHTSTAMLGAQRLYASMGFHRDPSLDWVPEPHIELLGYTLRLQPAPR